MASMSNSKKSVVVAQTQLQHLLAGILQTKQVADDCLAQYVNHAVLSVELALQNKHLEQFQLLYKRAHSIGIECHNMLLNIINRCSEDCGDEAEEDDSVSVAGLTDASDPSINSMAQPKAHL